MTEDVVGLRSASDALLTDLDHLAALELSKRDLRTDDPRLAAISRDIEVVADRVLGHATEERVLSEHALAGSPGAAPAATIEQTPPAPAAPRTLQLILEEWRDAERRAAAAPPGSERAAQARREAEERRAEYQVAYRSQVGAMPDRR